MKTIKIYTISWCSHCRELKNFLKECNLKYEDFDVENDEKSAEYIIEKTGQDGFPIIDINGEIIIGFDKEKIKKYI